MLDQITKVVTRFEEVERQMVDPIIVTDHIKLTELAQERSDLLPLVEAYRAYLQIEEELTGALEMREIEESKEMLALVEEEISELEQKKEQLEKHMRRLLIPKDKRDERNVFIEIRAGAGGDEAAIFAADLLRMYLRYAETHGFKTEIMDENFIGVGGYKEVIVAVKGHGAYSRFKFESGVHRVQRVPTTESQGRIHTSTATVAVMPEVDDVEITLDPNDLEITATFSAGPGGQHMQKNATAARVVHKPSGLMVKVQSERSLTQNKQRAMAIIQSRLQDAEEAKHHAELSAERRSQVGSGDRSEKIRTYNYPQSRVTDHRIGLSNYNLPAVLDGDLDEFIDQLTIVDESERLAAAGLAD